MSMPFTNALAAYLLVERRQPRTPSRTTAAPCRLPTLPVDGMPRVLVPYDPGSPEIATPAQAALLAGVSLSTIHRLVRDYCIGRKTTSGAVKVSRVALAMRMDGDIAALERYLAGHRDGAVASYYQRLGIEAPPWA